MAAIMRAFEFIINRTLLLAEIQNQLDTVLDETDRNPVINTIGTGHNQLDLKRYSPMYEKYGGKLNRYNLLGDLRWHC